MAVTKEERLKKIHEEALCEFDTIQSAVRDERLQCLQDRRFYSIAGAQWEGPLGLQFENKPRFEVNKIHLSVIRIINEYRNNRITVNFVSKDGSDSSKLADTCDGLYRADEQDSCAEEAYDNAFEEAVGGGIGAWRLCAEYEDEDDEDDDRQRIRMIPIYDADSSVFFDLDSKRQDKADATRCFVLTAMTMDAYKAQYGEDYASMQKTIHQTEFDWLTPDVVYVAEYYRVEEKKEEFVTFEAPGVSEAKKYTADELDDDPELRDELAATGFVEVKRKKRKVRRVHKYIISGSRVLEDCGIIAGKCIPIVVVYGKRWFVDNVERCMGHVRLAKDAQRLKNMQLSRLGEISALSTVEKPIFTPEQIARHAPMWEEDNIKNYPYLMVDPITNADGQVSPSGPIAYTKAPNIPPAMAALLQVTETDMQDVLGNQQAGEEMQPNMSGKAVELIQNRLDMQTFIYMSNMAKAIKRSGEIWLSMAKEILVEEGRKMKVITNSGEPGQVELMRPAMADGRMVVENNLADAKFDIAVDVGPSFSSKRAAVVRAVTGMMTLTQDPETVGILTAVALMNMEGEGLSDVNSYFRKQLVAKGVVEPTPEELEELQAAAQNQQPDPQALYLQAAAQEAEAAAARNRASTVLDVAKSEKTKAETIKTLADIELDKQRQALEVLDRIAPPEITPPSVDVVAVQTP